MSNEIPLSYPDIDDNDVRAVVRTLRSGRLSIGPELEEFERLVAARCRRHHGIGVSSGTAGLHLALLALWRDVELLRVDAAGLSFERDLLAPGDVQP